MEIVELIAELHKVVGHFTCSATRHLGQLREVPAGRRFERVDEVSIFRFRDGKIVRRSDPRGHPLRLQQLGLAER